jgi:hypothetical protein
MKGIKIPMVRDSKQPFGQKAQPARGALKTTLLAFHKRGLSFGSCDAQLFDGNSSSSRKGTSNESPLSDAWHPVPAAISLAAVVVVPPLEPSC